MAVEFIDNRIQIEAEIDDAVTAFLYEAGGELQAQIVRNSRTDTGKTEGSYQYRVINEGNSASVEVGSGLENAIWEEFGTGEYALHGDGRKGGWTYKSEKDGKFYRTKGKPPNQPMKRAFDSLREPLKRRLEQILKDRLGG